MKFFDTGIRLIIAGSRDLKVKFKHLDQYTKGMKVTKVVCGKARGIDTCGEEWALARGIAVQYFPVTKEDWKTHGNRAGHLRNESMANYGEELLLIWNGTSAGSRNMKEHMIRLGKPFKEIIITTTKKKSIISRRCKLSIKGRF